MYSRHVLFVPKYFKRTCFHKEKKHMFLCLEKYHHKSSGSENKIYIENIRKINVTSKMLGNFTNNFKKEIMKRKFLLFLTFSLMAISIDIRYVCCDKSNNLKIHVNAKGTKEFPDDIFNNIGHIYEALEKKNQYYILKKNKNVFMIQYAANSPIEDRCYICDLNFNSYLKNNKEKSKKQNEAKQKSQKSNMEMEMEDKDMLIKDESEMEEEEEEEEDVFIGTAEENNFVNNFKKTVLEKERDLRNQNTTTEEETDTDDNAPSNQLCLCTENTDQPLKNSLFRKYLVCSKHKQERKNNFLFAGVVDGHGGWVVAEIVKRFLKHYVKDELSKYFERGKQKLNDDDIFRCLENAHLRLDYDIKTNVETYFSKGLLKFSRIGACSLSVLITDNHYYVSNLGDAKGLLATKNGYVNLNNIHSANSVDERKKLIENHPNESDIVVCKTIKKQDSPKKLHMLNISDKIERLLFDNYDNCYVKGRLQPTRNFGDFYLKDQKYAFDATRNKYLVHKPFSFPYITAKPEIQKVKRSVHDQFLILTTDGVTDFLPDDEIVDIVRKNIHISAEHASKAVVYNVLKKASVEAGLSLNQLLHAAPHFKRRLHDDTTLLIIKLDDGLSNE